MTADPSVDSSELRTVLRLQDRLMHVSRLTTVGEMAAGVAHELNQPLAAIANYAQACGRLLRQEQPNMQEVQEALQAITAQAVRAGDIIRRLRGLARRQDGTAETADLNQLIRELTDLIEPDARHYQARCRLELDEPLPPVTAYPAQIQQAVLNLVRNALEALADEPRELREVHIRTCMAERGVEVRVCDTGPGISPVIRDNLFSPFCTTKPTGTGLGLATSHSIARAHGGTLEYKPNVPCGACFVLRLPAAA